MGAKTLSSSNREPAAIVLSTQTIAPRERQSWLKELICRKYAQVDITMPGNINLFQNLTIYPWQDLQLSVIQSSAITIQGMTQEPFLKVQDAYFAVVLLSGQYQIRQHDREVVLQPGDITLYDATLRHQIQCPENFAKLIIAIPREIFRQHLPSVDQRTALHIPGTAGAGLIVSQFLRNLAEQTEQLKPEEFNALAEQALDLLTLAVNSVRPTQIYLSRSRTLSLNRIKAYIAQNLDDNRLDTAAISGFSGLSARYINALFAAEDTSLMRYLWQRRLEQCHQDIQNPLFADQQLTEIALRWGFNDAAHFSRAFKRRFGYTPRDCRRMQGTKP